MIDQATAQPNIKEPENDERSNTTPVQDIAMALLWRIVCTVNPETAYKGKWVEWYHRTSESVTGRTQHAQELLSVIRSKLCLPQGDILELAAGTGHITKAISTTLDDRRVISLEIAKEPLADLYANQGPNGIALNADFNHLPLRDEISALIICVGGYRHVEDPNIFWAEVSRVAATDSYIVLSQFHPPAPLSHLKIFDTNPKQVSIIQTSFRHGIKLVERLEMKASAPKFRLDLPFIRGYYEVIILQKTYNSDP